MNCTTCKNCSRTCGNFPPLSEWKGDGFPCWEPWREEVSKNSMRAEKEPAKQNFHVAFYDPNITDVFAEKIGGQRVFVKKEERDCLFCSCFNQESKTCPVCPKNDDRNYAKRCASFGVKIKKGG